MKNKLNNTLLYLSIVSLLFIIVADYFPNIGINSIIGVISLLIFVLLFILTHEKERKNLNPRKTLIIDFIFGSSLILLLIILTLLGGESQSGISLKNPIIWLLYLIAIFSSWSNYKKSIRTKEEG